MDSEDAKKRKLLSWKEMEYSVSVIRMRKDKEESEEIMERRKAGYAYDIINIKQSKRKETVLFNKYQLQLWKFKMVMQKILQFLQELP
ncbi:hypothetical protein SUGI_0655910 [Cryptomeria japonica]|nr:hypothetical protein SUGI_0655870 [Cryptomeria japonica]GLJ32604.1 hypothetical protein SUGI_0655910 [Cryptomeria japonica]